jgi:CDP-diacylglycerol---glycerol-3-phosphate 3-phosphatidyltransferase
MTKLCNLITLIRGPIALLFLSDSLLLRTLSIAIAMVTDGLDGYLARRYNSISRLGTLLDPIMDKLFVTFLLVTFLWEGSLTGWQAVMLLSRDIAILLFGLFLVAKGSWHRFEFQSVGSGKLTTFLQFFFLIALTFHVTIPFFVFPLFTILGVVFWIQLYQLDSRGTQKLGDGSREPSDIK